jgi:hypothetical protein
MGKNAHRSGKCSNKCVGLTYAHNCNPRPLRTIMEYIGEIASFLVGLVSGVGIKVVWDARKTTTIQQSNRAGGDIAGRDIHKH